MISCEVVFPDEFIYFVDYPTVPRIGDTLAFVRTHQGKKEGIWKVHDVQWLVSGEWVKNVIRPKFVRVRVKVA